MFPGVLSISQCLGASVGVSILCSDVLMEDLFTYYIAIEQASSRKDLPADNQDVDEKEEEAKNALLNHRDVKIHRVVHCKHRDQRQHGVAPTPHERINRASIPNGMSLLRQLLGYTCRTTI